MSIVSSNRQGKKTEIVKSIVSNIYQKINALRPVYTQIKFLNNNKNTEASGSSQSHDYTTCLEGLYGMSFLGGAS